MRKITVILALIAASAGPLLTLDPLIARSVWGQWLVVVFACALIPLVALRLTTRWLVWPTIAALASGAAATLVLAAREVPDLALAKPGESAAALWRLLLLGVEELRTQTAPVTAGAGIAFLMATIAVLLFLAAEALGVGADSPVLAGIPISLLWVPHIAMNSSVPMSAVLLSIGGFAAGIGIGGPRGRKPRLAIPAIVGTTAIALGVTASLGPALTRAFDAPVSVTGGSSTRLNLGLDIRAELLRGPGAPLITYSGIAPDQLGPIHSHTLAQFDGRRWHAIEPDVWVDTTTPWPQEGSADTFNAAADARSVTLQIQDLAQDRLFLPAAPRNLADAMSYSPTQDVLRHPAGSSVTYTLSGQPLASDPEVLDARSTIDALPADVDAYLDLPPTTHIGDIENLTRAVTDGATSPYEQAVAIQHFLRSDPRFRYTTNVAGAVSDDAVWDFLEDGNGYCVQFATAMVIMARSVGIPARLAVGFLPGEAVVGDDSVPSGIINSTDAHAWPQLHLGTAGWVRFEPTPSLRTGSAPPHTLGVTATPIDDVEPTPTASETQAPSPTLTPTASATSPSSDAPERGITAWLPLYVLTALIAIAGILVFRRRHGRATGVEGHWQAAIGALAPLGLSVSASDTPSTILQRARTLRPEPEWAESLASFEKLGDAVNASRYEPQTPEFNEAELSQWAEETESLAVAVERAT